MAVRISKGRANSQATARARGRGNASRFVKPPPQKKMRKVDPDSAPRLYEWLTSNGYVEPVSTSRRGKTSSRRRR